MNQDIPETGIARFYFYCGDSPHVCRSFPSVLLFRFDSFRYELKNWKIFATCFNRQITTCNCSTVRILCLYGESIPYCSIWWWKYIFRVWNRAKYLLRVYSKYIYNVNMNPRWGTLSMRYDTLFCRTHSVRSPWSSQEFYYSTESANDRLNEPATMHVTVEFLGIRKAWIAWFVAIR